MDSTVARLPCNGLLDLNGQDVLTTRNDAILLAVTQFDVAIGVPYTDITGVEPAACERPGGCLRVAVIALHHTVALHHHFTHRLPIARDIVHGFIDDAPQTGGYIALSLPGEQACLLLVRKIIPFPVPLTQGIGAIGLGQPIDMDRPQVEFLHPPQQRRRGRRSSNGHGDLPVEAMRLGMVHQQDLHGGSAVIVRDAFSLEEIPHQPGLELAQADMRAPDSLATQGMETTRALAVSMLVA